MAEVADRGTLGAPQAELPRALGHALPHDAGQPERHHQQQESSDDRHRNERRRVLLQQIVSLPDHRPHVERPAARRSLEALHQRLLERRARAWSHTDHEHSRQ
jgi:hypothetical protein